MKIVQFIVVGLVALVALMGIVGAMLPRHHVASRGARFRAPADTLWQTLTDFANLPGWAPEPRTAAAVRVEIRDTTWSVVGTHLGLRRPERTRQAGRLREVLDGLEGPAVLAGDLNADLADPELAEVVRWATPLAHDPEAAIWLGPTYSSTNPRRRFDHILAGPGCAIIAARRIPVTFSDHVPIVAVVSQQEQS